jgi:hypothetical protein
MWQTRLAVMFWDGSRAAAHIDPLLWGALMDVGFAWVQPDYAAEPDLDLCADFLFAQSLIKKLLERFIVVAGD